MDTLWFIRSLIFLFAGLTTIFFPKQIYKFQKPFIKKFGIKYNFNKQGKSYTYLGISFIIISAILFVYSFISS